MAATRDEGGDGPWREAGDPERVRGEAGVVRSGQGENRAGAASAGGPTAAPGSRSRTAAGSRPGRPRCCGVARPRPSASRRTSRSNIGPRSHASRNASDVARGLELVGQWPRRTGAGARVRPGPRCPPVAPMRTTRRTARSSASPRGAPRVRPASSRAGRRARRRRRPGPLRPRGRRSPAGRRAPRRSRRGRAGPPRPACAIRARCSPKGPQSRPVWVKPCSTTSGGPDPRTSTWSGTPGERTGHLQRHPGRRVGATRGHRRGDLSRARGRPRWRWPWRSASGPTSASTSAAPPSSPWGWPWRPDGRRSSASRAARPRRSCIRPSSRRTTPGSRSSSAPRTGRPSCTTPGRRRPSTRTASSRRPTRWAAAPGVPADGSGGDVEAAGRPGLRGGDPGADRARARSTSTSPSASR